MKLWKCIGILTAFILGLTVYSYACDQGHPAHPYDDLTIEDYEDMLWDYEQESNKRIYIILEEVNNKE